MPYPLYIFFGLTPSFIWLLFFLRKDAHPESNRMILKIFFYGTLITIVAALIEIGILAIPLKNNLIKSPSLLSFIFYQFIGIAFVEEFVKYLVVREKVLNHPEFDEPIDAMLYMIIVALGFAALENILVLLPLGKPFPLLETLTTSLFRFLGATFLHALCSGILGYFLALSFFYSKRQTVLLATGLIIATFLHGLYNSFIIKYSPHIYIGITKYLLVPLIILVGAALFVSLGFRHLKKLKSICKPPIVIK